MFLIIIIVIIFILYFIGKNSKQKKSPQNMPVNNNNIETKNHNNEIQTSMNLKTMEIPRLIEIFKDSTVIIDNTTNFETFFSRYKLAEDILEYISTLDNISNEEVIKALEKLKSAKNKAICSLIHRSYEKTFKDASSLKTERGRQNRVNKFFSTIEQYPECNNPAILTYIKSLKS